MRGFDPKIALEHLRTQFRKGLPVLLTGAGFSRDATDQGKLRTLPTGSELAEELWPLGFPGEPFDRNSALQDIFQRAVRIKAGAVRALLQQRLTVGAAPPFYEHYFSAAWHRIYTLNIDDLHLAVARTASLPRPPRIQSALTGGRAEGPTSGDVLEIIALHGLLEDAPEHITFARSQYARRASGPDPWYATLAAELVSHPTVFVGSSLDEPLLWEHIELRRGRGNLGESRPRSYLVSPAVDRARAELLAEYNVQWLAMSAAEFAEQILEPLRGDMVEGIRVVAATRRRSRGEQGIEVVGVLRTKPTQGRSAYLLGREPTWSDISSGSAITRSVDLELMGKYADLARSGNTSPLLISGTAGSGKSTSLMRLALHLTDQGEEVAWIDRDTGPSIHEVISSLKKPGAPRVLAIDDADVFGGALGGMVRELVGLSPRPALLMAVRSGKVDRVLGRDKIGDLDLVEVPMPHLTDEDIDALISVLERESLLGVLAGSTPDQRRSAFRGQASRQLLVALYEATSGRKFEEKVADEYDQLIGLSRDIYAFIAVATHLQYSLPLGELLLVVEPGNPTLHELKLLESRHLISRHPGSGVCRTRHRVVADLVVEHLKKASGLAHHLGALAWAAATRVSPAMPRHAPEWKFLKRLLHHEFLFHGTSVGEARAIYERCEQPLSWDFHFWLQRGSLEVEEGRLELAELYLSTARSLAPDDPYVLTEWAYLLLRRASERSEAPEAGDWAKEGLQILRARIVSAGHTDHYPYHVIGAQGLRWARKGQHKREDRRILLAELRSCVAEGVARHPHQVDLKKLLDDLKREVLSTVVSD